MTHQVGRPPPRSALAESLLGLLRSAQAEAGYRQQEADSKALSRAAGRREVSLSLLDNPLRSFPFVFFLAAPVWRLLARMRARRRRTRMRVRQQSTTQGRAGRKQCSHSQASNQRIKACNEHGKASTRGMSCARQPAGPYDARAASAHRGVRAPAQRPLPGAQPGVGEGRPRRSSPSSQVGGRPPLAPCPTHHVLSRICPIAATSAKCGHCRPCPAEPRPAAVLVRVDAGFCRAPTQVCVVRGRSAPRLDVQGGSAAAAEDAASGKPGPARAPSMRTYPT